jgi:tryptophan synthase alpha chain
VALSVSGASDGVALSPIGRRFSERAAQGQSVLIPYITAGFPDLSATVEMMEAAADAGADVIELGIPFSDPLADGPTIQRSSFMALQKGTTVDTVLDALRTFRARRDTPTVLFTYLNPVLRRGLGEFCREAVEAGADGLLLTDLPVGCDPEMEEQIKSAGLDWIRLLAPTTSRERVPLVAQGGSGFLYYISRTGVTGARTELRSELVAEVAALREVVTLPIAVGFGISTPEQARMVALAADGVVVGSALIARLEREGVAGAAAFLGALRQGMDEMNH